MNSHFLDRSKPLGSVHSGYLPHWRQEGVAYFVTWRTVDSMPRPRVVQWISERQDWLDHHPEPHSDADADEYRRLFSRRWHQWLDECHGACLLARDDLRTIVEAAFAHFDGQRYELMESVVMPNHVHVLVSPFAGHELSRIVQSWKSFTAHEINKKLKRTSAFWQKGSFDHIVRNAKELERIAAYIRNNPKMIAKP